MNCSELHYNDTTVALSENVSMAHHIKHQMYTYSSWRRKTKKIIVRFIAEDVRFIRLHVLLQRREKPWKLLSRELDAAL